MVKIMIKRPLNRKHLVDRSLLYIYMCSELLFFGLGVKLKIELYIIHV